MGEKYLSTKTKAKKFNINRDPELFVGEIKSKLGTAKNRAKITVKSKERRDEIRDILDENGWKYHIKIRPELDEDISDLKKLQIVGVTKVNAINIGRNDLCYCGSGKKYKKCCLSKN